MANNKLKVENKMLKQNVSKKHFSFSPSPSHKEYIPAPLTPPQSYSSLSSPEGVSSPPTSPDIVRSTHNILVLYNHFYFYIYNGIVNNLLHLYIAYKNDQNISTMENY